MNSELPSRSAHDQRKAENPPVFIHIVTYNSAATIIPCIEAACAQSGYKIGANLQICVTDNASTDNTPQIVSGAFRSQVGVIANSANLGFCGGHNRGVKQFLGGNSRFMLLLNPDCALAPDALAKMVSSIDQGERLGMATPKLLRCDDYLKPLSPAVIDACGMELTNALRHLDRGSSQLDVGQFDERQQVFGGTGACLLIRRDCVDKLLLNGLIRETDVDLIYPELEQGRAERDMLFDEAFFAFREDADLCWRAKLLGWKCIYEPGAVAYHRRFVLPERRKDLPKIVNLWGVRNRFLLQLNNYFISKNPESFIWGVIFRNLIVLTATLLIERSSINGLTQVKKLLPRALERRNKLKYKIRQPVALK